MKKLMIVLLVAGFASVAGADQYWIAYEGNDFPENEGWERITYGGGAERSLEDGALVLDGLETWGSEDFYRMDAPIELAAGERFVMQWRVRIDAVPGLEDPGINMTVLNEAALTLLYGENSLYSKYEEGVSVPFTAGEFHDYQLTSDDLDTYTLRIDGIVAHYGQFAPFGWESGVQWGDYSRPITSRSTWDCVRFGVIPEPSSGAVLGPAALFMIVSRGRRR